MHRLVVALTLVVVPARPAAAQRPYRVSWWDAASVGTAGTLFVLPSALDLPNGAPSCGSPTPCDPAALSGIDRWAITPV